MADDPQLIRLRSSNSRIKQHSIDLERSVRKLDKERKKLNKEVKRLIQEVKRLKNENFRLKKLAKEADRTNRKG